jgi:hypothetical protein
MVQAQVSFDSLFGRGEVMETFMYCPVYDNATHGAVRYLESIAT